MTLDFKRSFIATLGAFALLTASASNGLALPVSTQETVEHAAALKSAPNYQQLPSAAEVIKKSKDMPYYGNVIEWTSANPNDAFLLCIHAWGLSAREFSAFGKEMANRGFDTEAMDIRGFGKNRTQKEMKKIRLSLATRDIGQIIAEKKRSNPNKKIFLVGESMGGAMVLKAAAEYPGLVDGVICSAPAWRIFSLKSITVKGLADQVFGEPGLAAKSITEMASSDPSLKSRWLSDSVYRMNYSAQEALGYWHLMRSTPKNAMDVKGIPILVMQGINDHLSKPDASVKLFRKLKNRNKELAIVLNGEHLVLEENQLKPVVTSFIQDWILKQMNDKAPSEATPQMVVIGDPSKLQDTERDELDRLKEVAGVKEPPHKPTATAQK